MNGFNYFYSKTVTFSKSGSALNELTGMFEISASNDTLTVDCDVQPLDTKIDIDTTGKLIDAEYKIFCDSDSFITANCQVEYKSAIYSITKITDWDDYLIVYIKAVK